jgi:hypothetical protein
MQMGATETGAAPQARQSVGDGKNEKDIGLDDPGSSQNDLDHSVRTGSDVRSKLSGLRASLSN